ncbi:peptidoglycan/LPS O-acetylase OafA/YrhL [Delftia acidovorans]|uniref:acyltransferase family protein n=1 Tax=Delftia acidovorans TaxID=80866 RepID=UPI000F4C40B5|nr:acyltransferase family protein [Delftia acidovorans]ROQ91782.1 peptidoglycan/LPS O-acetylase OafA/YrhL [Delftia acidovorans]
MDSSNYRPDIEGMRAVAIILVVLSHLSIDGFFAGFIGVDVFFVISGYLITGVLVREYESSAKIELLRFFSNRMRRLLPALMLVILVAGAVVYNIEPETTHLSQSMAAAMAVAWMSNIYFAFSDANYFSSESGDNAFLHTWSLGVEEQFYIVWPLIILAYFKLHRKYSKVTALVPLFSIIAILSLLACIFISQFNSIFSFYMMPTRAWQFSAGALVWVLFRQGKYSSGFYVVTGWVGAILLMAGLVGIDKNTVYPGWAAIIPTLAACALLVSGGILESNRSSVMAWPSRLMATPLMQGIGKISYAWYLWHWPVIIVGAYVAPVKGDFLNTMAALLISLMLAILTHYMLENPVRYGRLARVRHGWQMLAAVSLILIANSQLLRWNAHAQEVLSIEDNSRYVQAKNDAPMIYGFGCDDWFHSSELKPCVFGEDSAKKTAVIFGDSIGVQWFSTLAAMYDPYQWKIVVLTKSSCPMVDEVFFYQRIGREYTECEEWRKKAIEWLQARKVDNIFLGSTASSDFTEKQWTEGTGRILERLSRSADAIYVIEANPTLGFNGPDCLIKEKREGGYKCQSLSENSQYSRVASFLKSVVDKYPKAHWIETASFVCPEGLCQAMRNDTVVFRDAQHLTATFTAKAAMHFSNQMR